MANNKGGTMDALVVGVVVLLAVAFMVRHIRRATSGGGGCGCGCGGSGDKAEQADPRRVSVPGLSCSGCCSRCQCGHGKKA